MCSVTDYIIMGFLTMAAWSDLRKKQIPLWLLLSMAACSIVFRCIWVENTVISTIGGIMIGLFFFVMSRITREAIGYGDSSLMLILGIYLGGMKLLQMVFVASVGASLFSIIFCMKQGWRRNSTIPFVPFLTAAYLGVILL